LDAEVVKVIETIKTVVGRLHLDGQYPYVVVDDRRIKHNIKITKLLKECMDNQVVIVEILSSPTLDSEATGKVTDILGTYLDEGVEIDSALHRHQIPSRLAMIHYLNQRDYQIRFLRKIKKVELI